jgi:hypothetical protein
MWVGNLEDLGAGGEFVNVATKLKITAMKSAC